MYINTVLCVLCNCDKRHIVLFCLYIFVCNFSQALIRSRLLRENGRFLPRDVRLECFAASYSMCLLCFHSLTFMPIVFIISNFCSTETGQASDAITCPVLVRYPLYSVSEFLGLKPSFKISVPVLNPQQYRSTAT